MTSEELFLVDKKISENSDEVIISFGPFRGLNEIRQVDMMMYENIPEEIGRYDGHEVNMDDADGRLIAFGRNAEELFKFMKPMLQKFNFLQDAIMYLCFKKEDGTCSELEFKLNQVE